MLISIFAGDMAAQWCKAGQDEERRGRYGTFKFSASRMTEKNDPKNTSCRGSRFMLSCHGGDHTVIPDDNARWEVCLVCAGCLATNERYLRKTPHT